MTWDLIIYPLSGLNVLVGTRFSSKIDVGPPNPPHVHRLQGSTSSLAHRLVFDSGGHTIGTTQCQFFSYRLFNFSSNGPDSSIDPAFVSQLQALCPQNGDGSRRVGLDNGSPNRFDTSFFSNLRNGRGILESDQKLWTDASTRTFVQRFLGLRGLLGLTFNAEFGKSMVKMGNIEVKTGTQGEIRKVCSVVN